MKKNNEPQNGFIPSLSVGCDRCLKAEYYLTTKKKFVKMLDEHYKNNCFFIYVYLKKINGYR